MAEKMPKFHVATTRHSVLDHAVEFYGRDAGYADKTRCGRNVAETKTKRFDEEADDSCRRCYLSIKRLERKITAST